MVVGAEEVKEVLGPSRMSPLPWCALRATTAHRPTAPCRVVLCRTLYTTLEERQADPEWMREYNEDREHQGRWCFGSTRDQYPAAVRIFATVS